MDDSEAAVIIVLFLLSWIVIGNLIGMVLVLLIKPKGPNKFGKPGVPRGPIQAISACLTDYASAAGRSSRSEYWWFFLFCVVIALALGALCEVFKTRVFSYANYGLFMPMLVVQIRRLHDIKRSGWWVMLNLTGFPLVLYVLSARPGTTDSAETVSDAF